MIEGVIVAFFLAIVFVCLVGMAGMYKTKLYVAQEARHQNMLNATAGCVERREALTAAPVGEQPSITDTLSNFGIDFATNVMLSRGVSRTEVTGTFEFGAPATPGAPGATPQHIGGTVRSTAYVLCNETNSGMNFVTPVMDTFRQAWNMFAHEIPSALQIGF